MGRYFNRLQESYSIVHQMRMLGKKEWQSRGVARNKYLGGPGCNRDVLNIILKSIGYNYQLSYITIYLNMLGIQPKFQTCEKQKNRENKTPKEKQSHTQDNIYMVQQFTYVHKVAGISLLSKKITTCSYSVFLSQKQ